MNQPLLVEGGMIKKLFVELVISDNYPTDSFEMSGTKIRCYLI